MNYELKNSKAPLVLFIIFFLIIVGTVGYIKLKNNKKPKEEVIEQKESISRTINFEHNGYFYEIKQDDDKFNIIIKKKIDCEDEPCNPTRVDSYAVTDNKQIKDLKSIFNEVFSNSYEKEITINRNSITIDQYTILEEILRDPTAEANLTYKIIGPTDNSGLKTSGYKITKDNNKITITITMGERPTGGYSMEITKVVANADNLNIHVKENEPSPNSTTTQVITTPAISIELNLLPDSITIINEKNGTKYHEIKDEVPVEEKKEETPKENENYTIKDSTNNSSYKQKGYYIDEKTNTITIAAGSKKTGGYKIEITKVDYNNNEAIIYIKEIAPEKTATTIQAITYPIIQIEFKEKLNKITVVDENNKQLPLIK